MDYADTADDLETVYPAYPEAPAGAGQEGTSDLDRLTAIADTETGRTIALPIPDVNGRQNVTLRLQVGTITGALLQRLQKAARRGRKETDGFLFNAILIGTVCEEIMVAGKTMHDPDGDPYTFRSADLLDRLTRQGEKPITAAEAARRFIGSDGVIGSLSAKVLEEAGFGADLDADFGADPTQGG